MTGDDRTADSAVRDSIDGNRSSSDGAAEVERVDCDDDDETGDTANFTSSDLHDGCTSDDRSSCTGKADDAILSS